MRRLVVGYFISFLGALAVVGFVGCAPTGTSEGVGALGGLPMPGLPATDTDADGLNDREEQAAGTNPASADSDGDDLSDATEVNAGTDPLSGDSDDDGLPDGDEADEGTDPLDPDSDADGLNDGGEILLGTNPLLADTDADDVDDAAEAQYGTNPLLADTDGDGLKDGEELAQGTDPTLADTDADGLDDGTEIDEGTDPLLDDTDADLLYDGTEVDLGTDPTDSDTDGDGLYDATEVLLLLNPLVPNEVGLVTKVYSTNAVFIIASDTGVWFADDTMETFSGWRVGDAVAVARDEELPEVAVLVNVTRALWTAAINYGVVLDDGYITDAAINLSWIAVDGVEWYLNPFSVSDVYNWYFGDRVLVLDNPSSGLAHIVNLDLGEDALLAP